MTILPAIKSAALRLQGIVLQEVYTSSDQLAIELADLANEVSTDISKSHDWRALTNVATVTASADLNYPLPDDYDRMVLGADVDDAASWFWGYSAFDSVNDWMRFKAGGYPILSPGGWIILGDELQFFPAPIGNAEYPYISNHYAKDADGVRKGAFTADSDVFLLDDRLLTLGLIWRWLDQKGMPYAEAMQTYEVALSQEQARDRGSRVIRSATRVFSGARVAYTGTAMG